MLRTFRLLADRRDEQVAILEEIPDRSQVDGPIRLLDRGITPYMRTRDSALRKNNPFYGPERFTCHGLARLPLVALAECDSL
jgi:hypothetical protein